MTCTCAIGKRADADTIDTAIRGGGSVRKVAERFGLTKTAVGEHRIRCLGLGVQAPTVKTAKGAKRKKAKVSRKTKPRAPSPEEGLYEAGAEDKGGEEEGEASPDDPGEGAEDGGVRELSGAPDTSSDSTVSGRSDSATSDDARARARVDPKSLESFEERVGHVADLVAAGRWHVRKSAQTLADIWGVELGTVQNYRRTASLIVRADRGSIEEQRDESLGRWRRIQDKALREGDLKAAATAQTGYDKAAGVVESGGSKVQVNNFTSSDDFGALLAMFFASLQPFPTALRAVQETYEAFLRGERQPPAITIEATATEVV